MTAGAVRTPVEQELFQIAIISVYVLYNDNENIRRVFHLDVGVVFVLLKVKILKTVDSAELKVAATRGSRQHQCRDLTGRISNNRSAVSAVSMLTRIQTILLIVVTAAVFPQVTLTPSVIADQYEYVICKPKRESVSKTTYRILFVTQFLSGVIA